MLTRAAFVIVAACANWIVDLPMPYPPFSGVQAQASGMGQVFSGFPVTLERYPINGDRNGARPARCPSGRHVHTIWDQCIQLGDSTLSPPDKQKSPSASWGFFVCAVKRRTRTLAVRPEPAPTTRGFPEFSAVPICLPQPIAI